MAIKKGRAETSPVFFSFWVVRSNYLFIFLLTAARPTRPEPSSHTAPGMGT
jgi:hypothetical protein